MRYRNYGTEGLTGNHRRANDGSGADEAGDVGEAGGLKEAAPDSTEPALQTGVLRRNRDPRHPAKRTIRVVRETIRSTDSSLFFLERIHLLPQCDQPSRLQLVLLG